MSLILVEVHSFWDETGVVCFPGGFGVLESELEFYIGNMHNKGLY